MNGKLRIGLVQMRCEKADIVGNLSVMKRYIEEADSRDIDILGFPEMSLTGYADPTKYPQAIISANGPGMQALLDATAGRKPVVLAGFIEHKPRGLPFISQAVIRDGTMTGIYRKTTIKDEELRWFSPGEDIPVFTHDGITFGIAICADIDSEWVFAACARQGAAIVFELAAPGLYGPQETRDWESGYRWWEGVCREKLSEYARKYGIWIAVATQAGRTLDEDFPGGGYLFTPSGERVLANGDGCEGVLWAEIDFNLRQAAVLG